MSLPPLRGLEARLNQPAGMSIVLSSPPVVGVTMLPLSSPDIDPFPSVVIDPVSAVVIVCDPVGSSGGGDGAVVVVAGGAAVVVAGGAAVVVAAGAAVVVGAAAVHEKENSTMLCGLIVSKLTV